MVEVRAELETLPIHLRRLPLDDRGYPVPWFVAWIDGPNGPETIPDFRVVDGRKFSQAIKAKLCWVCGQPLGRWLAFPIGPMCAITRTTAEPPCHRDCAEWSIRNCPFLSQPRMVRRTEDLPSGTQEPAGFGIKRNPGVICLWMTRSYEVFDDGRGKPLLTVGIPESLTWWCEGRPATRAEVDASITSGLPILLNAARQEGRFAIEALEQQVGALRHLLPPLEA